MQKLTNLFIPVLLLWIQPYLCSTAVLSRSFSLCSRAASGPPWEIFSSSVPLMLDAWLDEGVSWPDSWEECNRERIVCLLSNKASCEYIPSHHHYLKTSRYLKTWYLYVIRCLETYLKSEIPLDRFSKDVSLDLFFSLVVNVRQLVPTKCVSLKRTPGTSQDIKVVFWRYQQHQTHHVSDSHLVAF